VSLRTPQSTLPDPARSRMLIPSYLLLPALIGTFYGWAVLVSTFIRPGSIGLNHIAPGTDWMVFYGAVRSALAGHLQLIMNGDDLTAYLNRSFADWLSVPLEFRPWFYPPSFLVLLLPFAPLGLVGSYVAFQVASGGFLAAALDKGAADPACSRYLIAAVLVSPAASINMVDGQCAFLVAALLVSGVRLLEARPILAGAVLGLLSFKPQFFLLVPVALLALDQWRSLIAAACSALVLAAISALIFGIDLWTWWVPQAVANLTSPDPKWVAYGRIWGHSVWACAVLLGLPDRLASLLQLTATAASAIATFVAFRSSLGADRRLAVLLAAAVLAAPHSGPYDATLLVVAVALWLVSEVKAPNRSHWLLGFGIWMVPLISPPTHVVAGRFAPLLTVALIGLILNELREPKRLDVRAVA
jgi:Glycosyltransferase family 87